MSDGPLDIVLEKIEEGDKFHGKESAYLHAPSQAVEAPNIFASLTYEMQAELAKSSSQLNDRRSPSSSGQP